jgi:hypothetical protein
MDNNEDPWLTYREAARRVRRTIRTINRWRSRGMPMTWDTRDGQRVRVVDESVLLAWWRARLTADPVHQQRIRRASHPMPTRPGVGGNVSSDEARTDPPNPAAAHHSLLA